MTSRSVSTQESLASSRQHRSADDFRVVAILAAYNEEDIIEQTVRHLIDQHVLVYFLDHGSTDGTVRRVEPFLGHGVLHIERFPGAETAQALSGQFAWEAILKRKELLARELDADWFIHQDADELRESPWSDRSLADAIQAVDRFGYNAIDFEVLTFRPTHNGFQSGGDLSEAFQWYEPSGSFDKLQIRAWKKTSHAVNLASSGGHDVDFPDRHVFPIRFLLRHYPIRSQAHGERKVFVERRGRFVGSERQRGWHVQYDGIVDGETFVRDPATLIRFDPDAIRLQLAIRHRLVEELQGTLDEAARTVTGLSEQNRLSREEGDARKREILRLRTEADTQNQRVEALRAAVESIERAKSRSDEALMAASGYVEHLQDELARSNEALIAASEHIGHLVVELSHTSKLVNDLLSSGSWKASAPLRAIKRLLMRAGLSH